MSRSGLKCFTSGGAVDAAGVAALLAMSAAFWFSAVQPAMERRAHIAAQLGQTAAQQRAAVDLNQQLLDARARLTALGQSVAKGRLVLEPVDALNSRLARIAALATARGLDLSGVRPGAATTEGRFTVVTIALGGSGDYRRCVGFLHDLHEQLPDVGVTGIKLISSPGTDPATPAATFEFALRWLAAGGATEPTAQPGEATASVQ